MGGSGHPERLPERPPTLPSPIAPMGRDSETGAAGEGFPDANVNGYAAAG